jgi:methylenetetrahydrofolate dehydrogenase (NADP+) / methenyltetrahydrofolate cyclohydrolase
MNAQMLDGKPLSQALRASLQERLTRLSAEAGIKPTLAVLQVEDDPAAAGYARAIERTCSGVGVRFSAQLLPGDSDQDSVDARLDELNSDPGVHGIMILEPLPAQIDGGELIDRLNPAKDVDGVHALNAGRLAAQRPPYFVPATPAGGIHLLEEAGIEFKGKHAVVIGRSDIVGKPMALLLLHRHCTVTIAHSRTQDLPAVARQADILCVAVGRAEMVKGDWIKPGAVVVDFGTTYTDAGLKGDCEQESVAAVAGMMTPVPGGTGPMTNVMLMQNLLEAAQRQAGRQGARAGKLMKQIEIAPNRGFDVIAGSPRTQAATMVLDVGESTGGPDNFHVESDQWLYVLAGSGEATVDGQRVTLKAGTLLFIEAREAHEIRNTGNAPLETLNIYAPPEY